MKKTLITVCIAAMAARLFAAGAAAAVSEKTATLSNGLAEVSFDVENGTFTIRDAQGRMRLANAGVGATSVKRGAAFTATAAEVNDAFGHGARITFTVRDDTAGARWGFHAAGYQHPHSKGAWEPIYTYTLYDDSPALIASFGVNTPVWYRRRLMGATVVRGGKWLGGARGTRAPTDFVTINSAAGAEPAHLVPGLTRNSANGILVTGLVAGQRRTLVAGGLQYDAFGKMAELDEGALTLYAADEVGVLVEPGTNRLFSADTFYIDAVTDDPFASAEAYGRAMRKANGADPNVYDFPLLCGWAVGALSKLGNINNAPALVKELDMANETATMTTATRSRAGTTTRTGRSTDTSARLTRRSPSGVPRSRRGTASRTPTSRWECPATTSQSRTGTGCSSTPRTASSASTCTTAPT